MASPCLSLIFKHSEAGAAWLDEPTRTLYYAATSKKAATRLIAVLHPSELLLPALTAASELDKLRGALDACATADTAGAVTDATLNSTLSPTDPIRLLPTRLFDASAADKRLANAMHDPSAAHLSERERRIRLEHLLSVDLVLARRAVGGLLAHLASTKGASPRVASIQRYTPDDALLLSPEDCLSLRIYEDGQHAHGAPHSRTLWALFNKTRSKPGERTLHSWFSRPTRSPELLRSRHDSVGHLISSNLTPQLHVLTAKVKDVSRLYASYDSYGTLLASDFEAALSTASAANRICGILFDDTIDDPDLARLPIFRRLNESVTATIGELASLIMRVIDFAASHRRVATATKHVCVRAGVHSELDALRAAYDAIQPTLAAAAQAECDRLRAYGLLEADGEADRLYVMYVPNLGYLQCMPTPPALIGGVPAATASLANDGASCADADDEVLDRLGLLFQFTDGDETYYKSAVCLELDGTYGDLGMRIKDLEDQLVRQLESVVFDVLPELVKVQEALAELDALLALTACAREFRLVRPTMAEAGAIPDIVGGWLPTLRGDNDGHGTAPVPNRLQLAPDERLVLLTGPNASGKSVYLRTVGTIVFLAHVGSYVPAESATIGYTDAIYTRMLTREAALLNVSAFMIDLSQTARMLRAATKDSLCLIDEFGKGTSAQDGIAMLYAILSHLLARDQECPATLACTHFTELLGIPELAQHKRLALWAMDVMVTPGGDDGGDDSTAIVMMFQAVPGSSADSYGLHCALAADMPVHLVERARHILDCRDRGIPVLSLALSEDEMAAQLEERKERDKLVDDFLEYDFAIGLPSDFFKAHLAQA